MLDTGYVRILTADSVSGVRLEPGELNDAKEL